ncbi:variant erythrocyte surface antigen-1 family protein, partial [Babesia divergens]|jgi:hypothetical protein
MDSQ